MSFTSAALYFAGMVGSSPVGAGAVESASRPRFRPGFCGSPLRPKYRKQRAFLHEQVAPSRTCSSNSSGMYCHCPEAFSGFLHAGLAHGPQSTMPPVVRGAHAERVCGARLSAGKGGPPEARALGWGAPRRQALLTGHMWLGSRAGSKRRPVQRRPAFVRRCQIEAFCLSAGTDRSHPKIAGTCHWNDNWCASHLDCIAPKSIGLGTSSTTTTRKDGLTPWFPTCAGEILSRSAPANRHRSRDVD